ncbi:MAG: hypothetical protein GF411_19025 [Candidatus Lokiarchaeota archaeon]|nr:hypothetical protein [Candidatus Lokiarchaeota archaeon]
MIDQKLLDEIVSAVLEEFPDQVELILLFGSHATGHAHGLSDIDIAVKLKDKADYSQDILDLLSLCDWVKGPKVDFTLINMANIGLQYRIATQGKLLYTSHERNLGNLLEYVFIRYPDWKIFHDEFRRMYLEG